MGYVYFVSYVIPRGTPDGGRNDIFSNTEVMLPQQITSIDQIQEMGSSIDRRAVILFYQFLREDFGETEKAEEAEIGITLPLFDQSRLVDLN